MTSLSWTAIFFLYFLGIIFEDDDREKDAGIVCFISCALCVALVYFPDLNTQTPFYGYAMVNVAALSYLVLNRFRVLSCLMLLSISSHIGMAASTLFDYQFGVYTYIIMGVNIGILVTLFYGSLGYKVLVEFCGYCRDVLPNSASRRKMDRIESEIYTCQLLRHHTKDV